MTLEAGVALGPYRIFAPIGAGGVQGQVRRARDTKLERDVAIKVFPEAFAATTSDSLDSSARRSSSSRSITNVASLYGLERTAGTRFRVLERIDCAPESFSPDGQSLLHAAYSVEDPMASPR